MRTILSIALLLLTLPAWAEPPGAPRVQRLGLREAIEQALRTDPQLLQAVIARDRQEAELLRAKLQRFSLKVDGSLTEQWQAENLGRSESSSSATSTDVETTWLGLLNVSANLQVPIFSGFRVTAGIDRARGLRNAAQSDIENTARVVALQVLQLYWGVRRLELQTAVSAKALLRYDEAVAVVDARVRAGLAPQVDLNRMQTRRLQEVARLTNFQGTAQESRATLAVALGLDGAPLELTEEPLVPPPPPEEPQAVDRLLAVALRQRPDLVAARQQTLAGEQQVRVARSGYYPQLYGFGLLQFANNPYGLTFGGLPTATSANPFRDTSGSFFVGATLSINLFDTFNTRLAVREATYEVSRLEQEERRLGRLVESDVRVAQARLGRLYVAREPLLKSRDLARDTLTIIQSRYQNGEALILDYIDAQVALLETELQVVDSDVSIAQAWGELAAATGRVPGMRSLAAASGAGATSRPSSMPGSGGR